MEDITRLDELELVRMAQSVDCDISEPAFCELFVRYKKYILKLIDPYFLLGADKSDLYSFGMLGLVKAIRTYDVTKGAAFSSYAYTCIRNSVFTAIRDASSSTQKTLNESTPIETLDEDGDVIYSVENEGALLSISAEESVILEENSEMFYRNLFGMLTDFESEVLRLFLNHMTYKEIAQHMDCDTKQVDNTLYRIRKKVAGLGIN